MSYSFGKRLRQPGGRLTVCRPESSAQLASEIAAQDDGGAQVTPPCDCYFCDNHGRPNYLVVGFSNFWENVGRDNGNCASLNAFNPNFTFPDPNGFVADWIGSTCAANVDSEIVVWTDGIATNPFGSAGCVCTYQGPASSAVEFEECGPGTYSGSFVRVFLGWSTAAGVFVVIQLYVGDPDADNWLAYQWNWYALETYNDPPNGAWPIGQINCCGDESQRNSLLNLLTAAQSTPTGPNGLEGGWVFEWSASNDPTEGDTCYICDGSDGFGGTTAFGATQPDAGAGIVFSEGGDTRVLPPCCCGGPVNAPYRCFWVCFQQTAGTQINGSGNDCCGNNCGSGEGGCHPTFGADVVLCGSNSKWSGTGWNPALPDDTLTCTLTYNADTGEWQFCFNCAGSDTCVTLTQVPGNQLTLQALCQPIGDCGSCGCVDITITAGPRPPCPSGDCSPLSCCTGIPSEIKVTIPPLVTNPSPLSTKPCTCPDYGGEYFLAWNPANGRYELDGLPNFCRGCEDDSPCGPGLCNYSISAVLSCTGNQLCAFVTLGVNGASGVDCVCDVGLFSANWQGCIVLPDNAACCGHTISCADYPCPLDSTACGDDTATCLGNCLYAACPCLTDGTPVIVELQ